MREMERGWVGEAVCVHVCGEGELHVCVTLFQRRDKSVSFNGPMRRCMAITPSLSLTSNY